MKNNYTPKTNIFKLAKSNRSQTLKKYNIETTNFHNYCNPILERPKNFKIYSQSIINTYKPLTETEKMKQYEDIQNNSVRRMKNYCSIFDKIKTEINDLSYGLNESYNKLPLTHRRTLVVHNPSQLKLDIGYNSLHIQEIEEEDPNCLNMTSKELKNKKTSKKLFKPFKKEELDTEENINEGLNEGLDESKNKFSIKSFPIFQTLKDIRVINKAMKSKKLIYRGMRLKNKNMSIDTTPNKIILDKPIPVKSRSVSKKKPVNFNQEYYGEPCISPHQTTNNQITQSNTCNCVVF